jgi:type IV secretion system protein VirB5
MKRTILAVWLLAALAAGRGAHASGVPVIDASNLAQAIEQLTMLGEQLNTLNEQLDTLRSQYATILNMYNEMRGTTDHAGMLPNPVATLHDFLPAADLDPSTLLSGPLGGVANDLRDANELFSAADLSGGTTLSRSSQQYQARSDFIYAYMALAKEAYENTAARRATLETFAAATTTATTQKAILDLNTRIAAENSLLLNDLVQLQALQLMARMQQQNLAHNDAGIHAVRPTTPNDIDLSR